MVDGNDICSGAGHDKGMLPGDGAGQYAYVLLLVVLLLVDRGFPSRRMLFGFAARDIPFVVRMIAGTTTDFAEVAAFMASGKADAEIDFT